MISLCNSTMYAPAQQHQHQRISCCDSCGVTAASTTVECPRKYTTKAAVQRYVDSTRRAALLFQSRWDELVVFLCHYLVDLKMRYCIPARGKNRRCLLSSSSSRKPSSDAFIITNNTRSVHVCLMASHNKLHTHVKHAEPKLGPRS